MIKSPERAYWSIFNEKLIESMSHVELRKSYVNAFLNMSNEILKLSPFERRKLNFKFSDYAAKAQDMSIDYQSIKVYSNVTRNYDSRNINEFNKYESFALKYPNLQEKFKKINYLKNFLDRIYITYFQQNPTKYSRSLPPCVKRLDNTKININPLEKVNICRPSPIVNYSTPEKFSKSKNFVKMK